MGWSLRVVAFLGACAAGACAPVAAPVAAPAARDDASVRVLVFNIHAGKDANGRSNLEDVASLVRSTSADIVLLQEVDRGTARSGKVDQLQVMSTATGLDSAFGRSLDYDGGQYGIAALSRARLEDAETTPLPTNPPQARAGGAVEPRAALAATTRTPIGTVRVMTTHLDASRDDEFRLQESAYLLTVLRERLSKGIPVLIGGDFNAEPGSRVIERLRAGGLRDAWTECGRGDGLTYPARQPVKRIDYLFLTGSLGCSTARVIETTISDHRPLLVTVVRRERSP
jgi:endonuclease/exonuclease/phosphatase family metal-dependent hydrolase